MFEFEARKSDLNKKKHDIDFLEAQALWQDERRIVIPARTIDESRSLIVGVIGDTQWSAAITYRENRIISVRRSREGAIRLYEGEGL